MTADATQPKDPWLERLAEEEETPPLTIPALPGLAGVIDQIMIPAPPGLADVIEQINRHIAEALGIPFDRLSR